MLVYLPRRRQSTNVSSRVAQEHGADRFPDWAQYKESPWFLDNKTGEIVVEQTDEEKEHSEVEDVIASAKKQWHIEESPHTHQLAQQALTPHTVADSVESSSDMASFQALSKSRATDTPTRYRR